MQPTAPTIFDDFARITNIIAGALAASVLVYMAIAWIVAPTVATSANDPEFIRVMAGILAVHSAGHLVVARVLFAARVRAAEKLPAPEQRLGGYRVAVIIAFAIREGVAIYGLVLSRQTWLNRAIASTLQAQPRPDPDDFSNPAPVHSSDSPAVSTHR